MKKWQVYSSTKEPNKRVIIAESAVGSFIEDMDIKAIRTFLTQFTHDTSPKLDPTPKPEPRLLPEQGISDDYFTSRAGLAGMVRRGAF